MMYQVQFTLLLTWMQSLAGLNFSPVVDKVSVALFDDVIVMHS